MPRKIYTVDNLDCANCAAKIEEKFNRHPKVEAAALVFTTRQLRLTAEDPDALLPELQALGRTVEEGFLILPQNEACGREKIDACGHSHEEHGHGCACGHSHEDHDQACSCGHDDHGMDFQHNQDTKKDGLTLLIGGSAFALGLLLEYFGGKIFGISVAPVVFVGAYLLLGLEVLGTAAGNLIKGHVFDENFLMSLATLGAFVIGEFPEAVGVMLFYRIGEYFEEKAVARSRSQIVDAVDMRPETVLLISEEGEVRPIPAGEAKMGDVLLVRPGDRIPLDGVVQTGSSRLDTAPITGEPVPVAVAEGNSVISGCVNLTGQLIIRVEKPLAQSMVTRILDAVENAAASKPKIHRFITRFARIYTPVVVGIAAITAIIPSLFTGDWNYWVYTALSFLVMSCPCALVLSVPLAFFSGIGKGSKQGILFKGGLSIEAMANVKAVAMDKTGTVTKGTFSVQKVEGGDTLHLCASCEQNSTHPIGESIVAYAKAQGLALETPETMEEISGKGIRAVLSGREVLCGNEKLMRQFGVEASAPEIMGTVVLTAVDRKPAGYLVVSDALKADAIEGVTRLKALGVTTVMLTGDNWENASEVASTAGIGEVYAKLLPQEKLETLQKIRSRWGATMFVGDGINDAPVLAGADVGAAMGSGADAAIEAADVVFMTSSVSAISESLEIARRTRRIAWQNVVFALAVKAVVMALGLMGYASMWMAVFADSGVAMLCVLNSIRLLYRK